MGHTHFAGLKSLAAISIGLTVYAPSAFSRGIEIAGSNTTVFCDGNFRVSLDLENTEKVPVKFEGAFGRAINLVGLTAKPVDGTIAPKIHQQVLLTGNLVKLCDDGLSSYTIKGPYTLAIENISIIPVPFSTIATNPKTPIANVNKPRKFDYTLTVTWCPNPPGLQLSPATIDATTASINVDNIAATPPQLTRARPMTKISGELKVTPTMEQGEVVLRATDAAGASCLMPTTDVHSN